MTYFSNITATINRANFSSDAGGKQRVSTEATLFDGKLLDYDNPLMFDSA